MAPLSGLAADQYASLFAHHRIAKRWRTNGTDLRALDVQGEVQSALGAALHRQPRRVLVAVVLAEVAMLTNGPRPQSPAATRRRNESPPKRFGGGTDGSSPLGAVAVIALLPLGWRLVADLWVSVMSVVMGILGGLVGR